jgi:hypothetical protein
METPSDVPLRTEARIDQCTSEIQVFKAFKLNESLRIVAKIYDARGGIAQIGTSVTKAET